MITTILWSRRLTAVTSLARWTFRTAWSNVMSQSSTFSLCLDDSAELRHKCTNSTSTRVNFWRLVSHTHKKMERKIWTLQKQAIFPVLCVVCVRPNNLYLSNIAQNSNKTLLLRGSHELWTCPKLLRSSCTRRLCGAAGHSVFESAQSSNCPHSLQVRLHLPRGLSPYNPKVHTNTHMKDL